MAVWQPLKVVPWCKPGDFLYEVRYNSRWIANNYVYYKANVSSSEIARFDFLRNIFADPLLYFTLMDWWSITERIKQIS